MVIDAEETKRSLFGGLKSSPAPKVEKVATSKVKKVESEAIPKWKRLEKVTVLLTNEQRDAIEDLARQVMRFRSKGSSPSSERERITANTVVRAMLDTMMEKVSVLDMESISNEDDLKQWLQRLMSR